MAIAATIWPRISAATRVTTPNDETPQTAVKTYQAPRRPPTRVQVGTWGSFRKVPPWPWTKATVTSARKPTPKDTAAAGTGAPSSRASAALIGACSEIAAPPSTTAKTTSHMRASLALCAI
jgi:hypothetical protein